MYNESTIYEYYESIMYTLTVLIRLTSLFGRLGRRALREAAAVKNSTAERGLDRRARVATAAASRRATGVQHGLQFH